MIIIVIILINAASIVCIQGTGGRSSIPGGIRKITTMLKLKRGMWLVVTLRQGVLLNINHVSEQRSVALEHIIRN